MPSTSDDAANQLVGDLVVSRNTLKSSLDLMHVLRSILAGIMLLVSGVGLANTLEGKVVAIADGDTITVLDADNQQHKIRLAAIDAPEKGQPFGRRAQQHLGSVVFLRPVRVEWAKRDRYQRIVGKVWVRSPDSACRTPECPKTLDIGLHMLTVGLAWHFKRYEREQTAEERERYAFAEEEARTKRAGLWMDAHPMTPWDWRNRARSKSEKGTLKSVDTTPIGRSGDVEFLVPR